MKCPLRLVKQKRGLGGASFGVPEQVEDFDFCLESECAWWRSEQKNCIMHSPFDSLEQKLTELIQFLQSSSGVK